MPGGLHKICSVCNKEIGSGGIVCPRFEDGAVHYRHCEECRFHESAGVCIDVCNYVARKEKWERINLKYIASNDRKEHYRKLLNIDLAPDEAITQRYKDIYSRLAMNRNNAEAFRGSVEMLCVLSEEITKRELF